MSIRNTGETVIYDFQALAKAFAIPYASVADPYNMFLGLPDPDLLVQGPDPAPDPSIIKQKY
jgi:hypothetical protein